MILTQGQRYKARLRLGFFEGIASNDTVREKLEDAGFCDVAVGGSGRDRTVEGTWSGATMDVDLPDQIVSSTVERMP